MLDLYFFGSPTVTLPDGTAASFRSNKSLALLAYLVLESDGQPTRSSLATLLWENYDDGRARRNLTQTLMRLRGDIQAVQGDYFASTRQTIGLASTAPIRCDVLEFEALLRQTKTHQHESLAHCPLCQQSLRDAIALANGRLLSGFDIGVESIQFEEWLLYKRESLHQMVLDTLVELADMALATGQLNDAIKFARRQIELEPWREKAHRQLIEALASDGQREVATAQFEQCKQALWEEMGLEISAETNALMVAIRSNSLMVQDATSQPKPLHNTPSTLPTSATPFIGRDAELDAIIDRLLRSQYRLVTLLGQGGIGKTRLAQEVGRRLLEAEDADWDAVYFVSFVGVNLAENVASTIASALNLKLGGRQSTQEQLIAQIREQKILLILDNFEQLMDAVDLLPVLLETVPDLHVLVTSRERLNLSCEDAFLLQGLSVPPTKCQLAEASDFASVRMFVERAYQRHKRFRLDTDTWPHIRQICRSLEGLPLGIELATTWIDTFSCAEIANTIATDARILETDLRDIAPHHRSLHLVFQRSWDQLSSKDQRALATLSVMRGSFTTSAAIAIAGVTPLALRRLHQKSLLQSDVAGRFALHTLVRQFSSQILHADPSEAAAAQQAHTRFFVALVEKHAAALNGNKPSAALQTLGSAYENILASWQRVIAQPEAALLDRMVDGIAWYHDASCLYAEGRDLLQQAVDSLPSQFEQTHPAVFGRLLMQLGALVCNVDYRNVIKIENRAIACAKLAQTWDVVAEAYNSIGRVQLHQFGDYEQARNSLELGLEFAQRGDNLVLIGDLERNLGNTYRQQGDYEPFLSHLERALSSYRQGKNRGREQLVLHWLAYYGAQMGRLSQSKRYLDEAVAMNALVGDPAIRSGLLATSAMWGSHFGEYEDAIQLLRKALHELEQHQSSWQICHTMVEIGRIYSKNGQHAKAIEVEFQALTYAEEHELAELVAYAQTALGYVYAADNQLLQAQEAYNDALTSWRTIGRKQTLIEVKAALANVAQRQGRVQDAQDLIAEILPQVLTSMLHATFEPLLIYWHCYQVLRTTDTGGANEVLLHAKTRLGRMVDGLDNRQLRQRLLEDVELHALFSAEIAFVYR